VDTQQLIKAFTATVQASLHGVESLHRLLQKEQDAILGKDPARLEQMVKDKLELLKQLEYGVQARDRLQQAGGFSKGADGGQQFVDRVGQDSLSEDWRRLGELGGQVADLNNQNGQLVVQGQQAARSALEILTGRSRRDDTYSTLRRRGNAAASCSLGKV
jgi:flagellar biosynthesis/type III secretory pathway chaperone